MEKLIAQLNPARLSHFKVPTREIIPNATMMSIRMMTTCCENYFQD